MENKEKIKAEDGKEVSYVDFNFKPEKDDDNLYIMLKIMHKNLKVPRAAYLKIKSDSLNRKYVEQQSIDFARSGIRALLEKNIIFE